MAPFRTQRDPWLFGPLVIRYVDPSTSPSRDVFSYISVRTSSVILRQGHSRGLTYGVASLEGEGLPVRPTLRVQSYLTTHPGEGLPVHLVPARLVPPVPEHLASTDLLLGERILSGEAPVLEGVAVREVPLVAASFSKYFPLSATT